LGKYRIIPQDTDSLNADHIKNMANESPAEIPESLRKNLGFLLNKAGRHIRESVAKSLQPLSLSLHEYVILRMIESKLADTQQAAGQRYDIDRTTMVEVVDGLEARQLLVREKNPKDRRSYKLILTPKGRKTLTRAKRVAGQAHKRFLEPLTARQQEELQLYLSKLIVHAESS
jgi:DNA-binding MarR family transcriptional regulator